MISVLSLWLPILLSAVLVFVVSSILHMVLTYHRADHKALPREAERLAALRGDDLKPGLYHFPHCTSPKEMGTPEMQQKLAQGPVGLLTVMPNGPMSMGKYLTTWFVFNVLVSFFVAYLTGRTVISGADYLAVFRVAGATAFMTYGLGGLVGSIWMGVPWSNSIRGMIDGLIYALVTAGTFAWLWPR